MKTNIARIYRISMSSILILTLVLIQFPTVSPAFNLEKSHQTRHKFTSSAKSNAAHLVKTTTTTASILAFSNPASISIADRGSGAATPNGISSPYPSTIVVSGLSGTLSNITVTLNGYTATRPRDNDFVLVGPGGQTLMLMSDAGDLISTGPGVTLTFSDAATTAVPSGTGSSIPSGTYYPTDINVAAPINNDTFPAPGPSTINRSSPTGSSTLTSVFNGIDPNGTWSLYAIDDALGGGTSTVSGGWSLDIATAGDAAATATSIVSSLNPSSTTQSVTFTASVISNGSPVTTGAVSFTDNGNAIAGCTNLGVNGSGSASCTTTLPEGTRTVTATYGGTASFGVSSGNVTQTVNSPTIVTGSQFCNNGGITLTDNSAANPYPANITVSGLVGTISKVTVNLNSLTVSRAQDVDFLLVGPGGQAFKILADAGDASPAAGINLTLDDAAIFALPIGSPLASGTFRPTDGTGVADNFPAPAPPSVNSPAPTATATFASVYNGIDPNGNWALYAVDDALGGAAGSLAGVCLNFTLNQFSTTTTIASLQNPSNAGANVTFTATVTSSSSGATPSGTVEFFDGATSLGTATLNGSGQAVLTTSALTAGAHNITAQYLGANVGAGGGGFTNSTSGILIQVVVIPDTTAPDTMITANPPNLSNSGTASFSFTGDDFGGSGIAGFECDLDGNGFAACTSPQTYTGLSDGSHTFQVRAIDADGNIDASPASYTWAIDTVAPTATINQAASQPDPVVGNGITIHFTAVFSEPVTGFGNSPSDVTLSGSAGATTVVITQIAPNDGTIYNVAVSGMANGGTVIANIPANGANDAAGNANAASSSTDNTVTYIPNSPPTANPDSYSTNEDTPLNVGVPGILGNDSDPDTGDTTTAVLVNGPSNAQSFALNANGAFTYTPASNFNGSDSFTYKARDGYNADSSVVTVTIAVNPVNDAPSFISGGNVTVAEDSGVYSAAWATAISKGPANESAQTLNFVMTNNTNPGLFSAAPEIAADGTLSFTPVLNASGSATISVVLMDNGGTANGGVDASAPVSFTITVTPVNDAPSVSVIAGGSCGSGASGTINLLLGDADTPASSLVLNASSSNTATVPNANIVFGGSGANRTLTINAISQNSIQSSTITITVSDGLGGTSTLMVEVIIGTNKTETLNGTSGADIIFGGNGQDTINAGAGNDLVCGGNGNDNINGGDGDDTLIGENGDDVLSGEIGNDILIGENGNDTLTGGAGADFFSGGSGTNTATDYTPNQGDTSDGTIARLIGFSKFLEERVEE